MNPIVFELTPAVERYRLDKNTHAELSSLPIVRLLGPFAVGKTALIDETSELDRGFFRVKGFTTREKRPGEQNLPDDELPHRFLETEEDAVWLKAELRAGRVAHVMQHRTTRHIMGSLVEEYRGGQGQKYPIIDLSYAAVDKLPSRLNPFMVVAPPDEWWERVQSRQEQPDFESRVSDALACLEWGLGQPGDALVWIVNENEQLQKAASEIIGIAKGDEEPNPELQGVAEELYASIKHTGIAHRRQL